MHQGRTAATELGWAGVCVLCLVQFVDVLGVTVVITALPAMLAGLGAPASASTLVVTGYAMFFGGLLMLGARLGDRYGHRRVLLLGLAGFAAASLLAATRRRSPCWSSARCAQGVAAAASVPTALRLLTGGTRDERRRRGLAAWSAAGAAAGASGFLLGGRAHRRRRVGGGLLDQRAARRTAAGRDEGHRARSHPPSRRAVWTSAAPCCSPAASWRWWWAPRCSSRPTIDGWGWRSSGRRGAAGRARSRGAARTAPAGARRRRTRRKLRLGLVVAFLNTATTSSVMTLATLHLQHTEGASATRPACSSCRSASASSPVPAWRRHCCAAAAHPAAMTAGLALVAVGDALLLALPLTDWILLLGVAVAGCGIGLSSVGANTSGTDVSTSLQGTASGALNTAAQLGHALGVAGLVLLATLTEGDELPLAGYAAGLGVRRAHRRGGSRAGRAGQLRPRA
jgi:MFS family permease